MSPSPFSILRVILTCIINSMYESIQMIEKLKGILTSTILNRLKTKIISEITTEPKKRKYTEKKYNISNKTLFCFPLNRFVIYFTKTYILPLTHLVLCYCFWLLFPSYRLWYVCYSLPHFVNSKTDFRILCNGFSIPSPKFFYGSSSKYKVCSRNST